MVNLEWVLFSVSDLQMVVVRTYWTSDGNVVTIHHVGLGDYCIIIMALSDGFIWLNG